MMPCSNHTDMFADTHITVRHVLALKSKNNIKLNRETDLAV